MLFYRALVGAWVSINVVLMLNEQNHCLNILYVDACHLPVLYGIGECAVIGKLYPLCMTSVT